MTLQLATAGVNVVRDNHWTLDRRTGLYRRSTLLEGQRTNGWTKSDAITVANGWSLSIATDSLVANQSLAPDGTMAMSAFTEGADTGAHVVYRTLPATTDNAIQSGCMTMKAGARGWAQVRAVDKAGVSRRGYVNLATGAIGTVDAGLTIRVRDRDLGRWRIEASFNVGTGGTTPLLQFGFATADANASLTGVPGQVAGYVWRGQYEADQPFCSSDIPTDAVSVTRSTDAATTSLPASLTTPQAMTLYLDFNEAGTVAVNTGGGGYALLLGGTNSTAAAHLRIYQNGVGSGYVGVHANGTGATVVTSSTIPVPAITDSVELMLTISATGALQLSISINGGAISSSAVTGPLALAGAWNSTVIALGSSTAFTELFAFKIARGVKSMAQMRAF